MNQKNSGSSEYCTPDTLPEDIIVPLEEWRTKPGDIFGNWTVESGTFRRKYGSGKFAYRHVVVKCCCGFRKAMPVSHLINGHTTNCGCVGSIRRGDKARKCTLLNHDNRKQCSVCKRLKDASNFNSSRTTKDNLTAKCKQCVRNTRTLSKYGLTEAQYNELATKQKFRCACCKRRKLLVIDHCHRTGVVRGLLCKHCNVFLGYAKDSIKILSRGIIYLSSTSYSRNCNEQRAVA